MELRQYSRRYARSQAALMCAGLLGLLPVLCMADGARVSQKARPGEIIVDRNVAARPADRPATAPGMALLVSPSPNPQLVDTTTGSQGPGEMTDAQIADLHAGPGAGGPLVLKGVQRSLPTALGANGDSGATASNNGVSNTLSAPTAGGGAIADSTRNIGAQVTSAIAQVPVLGVGH